MSNPIKVKIVYRRYKPLHQLYYSLTKYPPREVEYNIPKHLKRLKKLLPIYRILGDLPLVQRLIRLVQKYLFESNPKTKSNFDVVHFTQMLPEKDIIQPYVVDFEHTVALGNFVEITKEVKGNILGKLQSEQCKKIMPLSEAAKKTLETFAGDQYNTISQKVEVIYPALPNFYNMYKDKADHSVIPENPEYLNLLFVGNGVYRKGLHELLEAVHRLNNPYIKLFIVSDIPKELKSKYTSESFIYLEPNFSKEEIIQKLFMPADLFVMPTHGDSFGMVYLDALSSGTPVITTKQFAIPEFVTEKYNGLFVKSERLYFEEFEMTSRKTTKEFHTHSYEEILIKDLMQKIEMIYNDRDLLRQMSNNAPKQFEPGGKFSVDVRNDKLISIYREALK